MKGKNMKTCKCKVCVAFKAQKMKLYSVVWAADREDYKDYYFLAVGKTKRQFTSALKRAQQTVLERQPAIGDCFEVFCDALSNYGFTSMDDISCASTVYIDADSPPIPGATIRFDKVY